MKRRDFVQSASMGLAGMLLPPAGFGQTKPCAPPVLTAAGGTTATTSCSDDALSDWISRSTGPGVVWAHNFDTDSEITAFRENAAASTITRFADGPTAASPYSMNIAIPQGLKAGETWTPDGASVGGWINHTNGTRTYYTTSQAVAAGLVQGGSWYRPMSALAAGANGKETADPGAGGSLPRRGWSLANGQVWRTGYYGHASEQARYPSWLNDSKPWDGNEFYLQMWVKFSPNRWNYDPERKMGQPNGKLVMIQCMRADHNRGELVISSNGKNPQQGGYYWRETAPFSMYTAYGSGANADLSDPQGRNGSSPYPAQMQPSYGCRVGVNTDCWEWPKGEWVNILLRVKPGPHSQGNPSTFNATNVNPAYKLHVIEAWAVRASELAKGYTKIWSKSDYYWLYGEPGKSDTDGIIRYQNALEHPPAFNALAFNGYMNTWPAIEPFYQRFSQIIFSKLPIPCPKA
jgi:hypothetical protein